MSRRPWQLWVPPEKCESVARWGDHLYAQVYSRPLRRLFRRTLWLRCWYCDLKVQEP